MRQTTTDRIDPFGNTASMSVHGAVHSLHDDFYGLALILVIERAFADAIIKCVDELALQCGIPDIAPRDGNFASRKCIAFHDFPPFNLPRRKVYAPPQTWFVRKPT